MAKRKKTTKRCNSKREDVKLPRKTINRRKRQYEIKKEEQNEGSRRVSARLFNKRKESQLLSQEKQSSKINSTVLTKKSEGVLTGLKLKSPLDKSHQALKGTLVDMEKHRKKTQNSSIKSARKASKKAVSDALSNNPTHLKRSQRLLNRHTKMAKIPTKKSKVVSTDRYQLKSPPNKRPQGPQSAIVELEKRRKKSRNSSIGSARKATKKTISDTMRTNPVHLKRSQKLVPQSVSINSKAISKSVKVSEEAKCSSRMIINQTKKLKTLISICSNASSRSTSKPNTEETFIFNVPKNIPRNADDSKTKKKRRTSIRINSLKPFIRQRSTPIPKVNSNIQFAKQTLHVSAVPETPSCREKEFNEVYNFMKNKLLDTTGGCMYVSGVPGSGKTATITKVIRLLQHQVEQQKLPEFKCIKINGMRLTDPRLVYVHIYHQLTSESVSWQKAHSLLGDFFNSPNSKLKTTVLLVDEFDTLKTHRQDVMYNLLDWATKKTARLLVIAIANVIDVDRFLTAGVTSRLGSTRMTFQPYTQNQLQEIVQARLTGMNIFETDALQLVARKVASISGDCRRALDICRRAVEISEKDCNGQEVMVSMSHVQKAFDEMITNPKVIGIKGSSKHEKLFLQAVAAEVERTGVDETVFFQVYRQFKTICALNGVYVPDPGIALRISCRLGSSGLLICEHSNASIHQKIMLNVAQNELCYAFDLGN